MSKEKTADEVYKTPKGKIAISFYRHIADYLAVLGLDADRVARMTEDPEIAEIAKGMRVKIAKIFDELRSIADPMVDASNVRED